MHLPTPRPGRTPHVHCPQDIIIVAEGKGQFNENPPGPGWADSLKNGSNAVGSPATYGFFGTSSGRTASFVRGSHTNISPCVR